MSFTGNLGSNPGNGSSPRRRVMITRGYDGVTSMTDTKVRPIADDLAADANVGGVNDFGAGQAREIFSGLVISLNDAGQWVRGQYEAGRTCYIAQSNAADTDIIGSGFLGAFSCGGEFVIENPWFALEGEDAFGQGQFAAPGAGSGYTYDYKEDQDLLGTPLADEPNAGFLVGVFLTGGLDNASRIIAKVVKGVTQLNRITDANPGPGIPGGTTPPPDNDPAFTRRIHPRTSNENGASAVITFKTTQG